MKTKDIKYFPLAILLILSFFFSQSCEKEEADCFEPKLILSRVSFVGQSHIRKDTMIDSVYINKTVVAYNDTFFKSPVLISFHQAQNVKVTGSPFENFMGVPLNPETKSISYALIYDTTRSISDTLTYFYTTSVHFISNACGFTHFYSIDSIKTTKHLIDSSAINQRKVTDKTSDRHVQLFFVNS